MIRIVGIKKYHNCLLIAILIKLKLTLDLIAYKPTFLVSVNYVIFLKYFIN